MQDHTSTGSFSGYRHRMKFHNGYGASIVSNQYSYGGNEGLFEIAVLEYDENDESSICYDTPITDDVLGYLTWGDVDSVLEQIKALPPRTT